MKNENFHHAPLIVLEYPSQSQVAVFVIPQFAYICHKHSITLLQTFVHNNRINLIIVAWYYVTFSVEVQ